MSISSRISEVCKIERIQNKDLVEWGCGSQQTVSFVLNGKQKPNSMFLQSFLKMVKKLNARWLMTGEGEMFSVNKINSFSIEGNRSVINNDILGNNTVTQTGNEDVLRSLLEENQLLKTENSKLKDKIIDLQGRLIQKEGGSL